VLVEETVIAELFTVKEALLEEFAPYVVLVPAVDTVIGESLILHVVELWTNNPATVPALALVLVAVMGVFNIEIELVAVLVGTLNMP
jgi:hypothetical protein